MYVCGIVWSEVMNLTALSNDCQALWRKRYIEHHLSWYMILDKLSSSTLLRMLKPAFVNSWITHSLKRPKTAVHCPVYIAGCEKKRKMVLESEHCENSEIKSAVEDVLIMKELQSPFTYKLQIQSWTATVLRSCGDQMNQVACLCKDKLKGENLSLSVTLNHNPKCNISSLCDISVSLVTILYDACH